MTSFGDELRNLIAKKAEQLDVAQMLRLRQIEEEMRKEHALDEAVAAVVRDVFQPLMTELYDALLAAGVSIGGQRSEAGGQKGGVFVARHKSGAHVCALSARGQRAMYRIRFFARANPEGRIELAAEAAVREPKPTSDLRPLTSWQQFFDTADTADTAAKGRDARLRLDGQPLVEIAPKSIAPDPASLAAEQWARAALKKIAAACVAAERSGSKKGSEGEGEKGK